MLKDASKKKELIKLINTNISNDLSSFIRKSFYTVNPNMKYLHNWHIDLISEYLTACERSEIKRLVINIPPRTLKSICVSVAWPAWLLGHNPARRIIASSYSQNLSLKHSLDSRLIINSDWYKSVFPNVKIASGQNEKYKFVTTQRGFRLATSVGGTVTGEGGNYLIVDDPHNPAQALSDVQRKSALEWFDQTFSSRLDDKKRGRFVVVMQRLHENDLTGHLLEKGGWEHLFLPAIAEKKTIIQFKKMNVLRDVGDLLHEKREGKEEMETVKRDLGSYAFAGQYQQTPVPIEGGMIKPSWIKRYRQAPCDHLKTVQSWDTAIKSGAKNDYSVCTTWVETESGYYLLDVHRKRMEYPDLKRTIISMYEKWQPYAIIVEDKASGQSLLQDLRRETKLPVIPIMPVKDKITRMAAASALIEAGKVFLPQSGVWLVDYESELFAFPSVTHDDQTDSTSQYLNWIKTKRESKFNIRTV